MPSPKKDNVERVLLNDEVKKELLKLATSKGMSRSAFIRMLIMDAIAANAAEGYRNRLLYGKD